MVHQRVLGIVVLFIGGVLWLAGCVSSEETGAGSRAKSPVQILGPIDTTHRVIHRTVNQDSSSRAQLDSSKGAQLKKTHVAPKFRSRQDTVRASVVMKSKLSSRPSIKIIRPDHPVYTVQVGAFNHVSNALRAQKRAKDLFAYQSVFNTFVKRAKLYRVSIGKYENRKDAQTLCDSLQQQFPREYKQCWVNFIQ
jgi:cell division protein FtsN